MIHPDIYTKRAHDIWVIFNNEVLSEVYKIKQNRTTFQKFKNSICSINYRYQSENSNRLRLQAIENVLKNNFKENNYFNDFEQLESILNTGGERAVIILRGLFNKINPTPQNLKKISDWVDKHIEHPHSMQLIGLKTTIPYTIPVTDLFYDSIFPRIQHILIEIGMYIDEPEYNQKKNKISILNNIHYNLITSIIRHPEAIVDYCTRRTDRLINPVLIRCFSDLIHHNEYIKQNDTSSIIKLANLLWICTNLENKTPDLETLQKEIQQKFIKYYPKEYNKYELLNNIGITEIKTLNNSLLLNNAFNDEHHIDSLDLI